MSVATYHTRALARQKAARRKIATGFRVPCRHCGSADGLFLRLHDLTVCCVDCCADVTRQDLERVTNAAVRLIRWIDAAATS